jgi:hypothetical protein
MVSSPVCRETITGESGKPDRARSRTEGHSLTSTLIVSAAELPSEVRAFIVRHLTSGAQLQVLLLLHGYQDRSWSPAAVGRELRIDLEQASWALSRLAADGLLAGDDEAGYRFETRVRRKAHAVDVLAALYPTYRVAIISLIFSKPSGAMSDFSDAFRLREEDDDG